jgi:nickel/cobalt transporter (NicO) family protein
MTVASVGTRRAMEHDLTALAWTAAGLGFVHTLAGPDHYLPFVAMARIGRWSMRKTVAITLLCGLGHVLGSLVLGLLGLSFGVAVFQLETIESVRGEIAAWLLLGFGVAYCAWGIRRAVRNIPHTHYHRHLDETVHAHQHTHQGAHLHAHARTRRELTPWILFTIFLFGPCEVLIPLVMYPAAQGSFVGVAWVAALFGVTTIGTMTVVVSAMLLGVGSIRFARLSRYGHALAGLIVFACGLAVKLGL